MEMARKPEKNSRIVGFSARGRQPLIDRKDVTENGKINYIILAQKVDELGHRLVKEARLLERI